jgi:hypothetical protein
MKTSAKTRRPPVRRASFKAPIRPWMLTASGRQFFPTDPHPNDVDIGDIAHALSHLCRFNGHTRIFWSVAQHSLLVSDILQGFNYPVRVVLAGLMHDATEAYCGDVIRPIKCQLGNFGAIESRLAYVIQQKFSLAADLETLDAVKRADNVALATERRDLMPPSQHPFDVEEAKIAPWPDPIWNSNSQPVVVPFDQFDYIKDAFLDRFQFLTNAINDHVELLPHLR